MTRERDTSGPMDVDEVTWRWKGGNSKERARTKENTTKEKAKGRTRTKTVVRFVFTHWRVLGTIALSWKVSGWDHTRKVVCDSSTTHIKQNKTDRGVDRF